MNKMHALSLASMLAVALAVPLSAQTVTMEANIPFAFTVGTMTLPAGEYMIRNSGNPYVLIFQAEDGSGGTVTLTSRESVVKTDHPAADTKLVFNRYGKEYFLSEVVDGYVETGFIVPMPKSERELARSAAAERHTILATATKG